MSGEERRESQGRRHRRGDTRAEFCGYKGVCLPGRLGVDSLDPQGAAHSGAQRHEQIDALFGEQQVVWAGIENASWERANQ